MSLYGAMFAGVSGLSAQSSAMGSIADNVTNINTIGYKGTQVNFQTLVTKQVSSTKYSPGGVQSKPRAGIDVQGLLQATTSATDLGISGQGFFVVSDQAANPSGFAYTRAGSFKVDRDGYLQNVGGYYMQGWPLENWDGTATASTVSKDGNIYMKSYRAQNGETYYMNDNAVDSTNLRPLNLTTIGGTARATSTLALGANLPAAATVGSTEKTNALIFDSLGNSHNTLYTWTKRAQNAWDVELLPPKGSTYVAINDQTAAHNTYFSAGRLDFTSIPAVGSSLTVDAGGMTHTFNFTNSSTTAPVEAYSYNAAGATNGSTFSVMINGSIHTFEYGIGLTASPGAVTVADATALTQNNRYAVVVNGTTAEFALTDATQGDLLADLAALGLTGLTSAAGAGNSVDLSAAAVGSNGGQVSFYSQHATNTGAGGNPGTLTIDPANVAFNAGNTIMVSINGVTREITLTGAGDQASIINDINGAFGSVVAAIDGADVRITTPGDDQRVTVMTRTLNNTGANANTVSDGNIGVEFDGGDATVTAANFAAAYDALLDDEIGLGTWTDVVGSTVSLRTSPTTAVFVADLAANAGTLTRQPQTFNINVSNTSLSQIMDQLGQQLNMAMATGPTSFPPIPPGALAQRISGENAVWFRQFSAEDAITVDTSGLTNSIGDPAVMQNVTYEVPTLHNTVSWMRSAETGNYAITFNGDGSVNRLFGSGEEDAIDPRAQVQLGWANGALDMDGGTIPEGSPAISLFLGNYKTVDGFSQLSGDYQLNYISQNGNKFGNFAGLTVGEDGIVTALFDNGVTTPIFMIPVSTFVNPNGMESMTGNVFQQTDVSGLPTLREAGSAGAGVIAGAALESSTVDLGEEFTAMITTQRAYSAAAKIITTSDEMLEELVRIKR